MSMVGKERPVAGLCWFQRETYDACMLLFSDADKLPDTFDDWLIAAEQAEKTLTERGINVVRVETDPKTLLNWCNERGYSDINTIARQTFAAHEARRRFGMGAN